MATPQYTVLDKAGTFIGSTLIPAGSVIETDGPPGPHLDPLNDEAKARMQTWYDEEYPLYDDKFKRVVVDGEPQFFQPHKEFEIRRYASGEAQTATVLAPPPRDMKLLSLSEVLIKQDTDVRPPPAIAPGKVTQLEESLPEVKLTKVGPKPNTVEAR